MPNHTHLVVVPGDPKGLARAIGEAHRRYTRAINFKHKLARIFMAGAVRLLCHGRPARTGASG